MSGSRVTAGVLLAILMLSPVAGAQQIVMDANSLTVREGGKTLLQYRYADVPFKPYIKELYTPGGLNILLDAPPDHLHHHALMFACAVNNVDFWGEAPGGAEGHFERLPGRQVHRRLAASHPSPVGGPVRPPFEEWLYWTREGEKEPLLMERRTITACFHGEPNATLVMWESRLEVSEGKEPAILSGSHYHGLGMRFVRSMDANGEFRNADNDPGVIFRGEERLSRSRWCAYTAQVDGKTVTAAMFDHPSNPRHPATWFTMAKPFAYLSATMRLHEEPLKLLASKPLTLRYGVALWDGRPNTERVESVYKEWVMWVTVRQREVQLP